MLELFLGRNLRLPALGVSIQVWILGYWIFFLHYWKLELSKSNDPKLHILFRFNCAPSKMNCFQAMCWFLLHQGVRYLPNDCLPFEIIVYRCTTDEIAIIEPDVSSTIFTYFYLVFNCKALLTQTLCNEVNYYYISCKYFLHPKNSGTWSYVSSITMACNQ